MMRVQTNRIRTFSAFGTILKGLLVLALFFSVPASVFAEEIPEGNPNETTEEAAVKEPDSLTEEENDPEPETDLREETADEDTAAENTAEPVPEEEIPEESSGEETGKKAEDGEEESGASAMEESTSSETSFPMDSGLPSSCNSADFEYVTPIRNQNPFGTCISFGFIAAAESSVLKHNLLPGKTAQTLDFSERHLFWFASHAVPDPLGNTVGDDVVYVSDPKWDDPGTYIKHASPNTSDPFESANHWTVFVTSSLTALGSLLVLRQRR